MKAFTFKVITFKDESNEVISFFALYFHIEGSF